MSQGTTFTQSPNMESKESKLLRELKEPVVKTDINRGGSLRTGGALGSGGGLASGGALQNISAPMALPKNHFEMYHHTLRMNNPEWELMRETAGRQLGMVRSPMYHESIVEPLQTSPEHYMKIAEIHHPTVAAKMLEHEALTNGSGFFSAMKHTLGIAARGWGSFKRLMKPILRNKDILQELPVIGQYVKPGAQFLEKAFQISDVAAAAVDKIGSIAQPFLQGDNPNIATN